MQTVHFQNQRVDTVSWDSWPAKHPTQQCQKVSRFPNIKSLRVVAIAEVTPKK